MLARQHLPAALLLAAFAAFAARDALAAAPAAAADLGYWNVKTFGAAGNGAADDTAAIDRTLAAAKAAGNGTVFFPAGVYKTMGGHDLSGTSGLRILGSGIGATVLKITHPTHDLFSSTAGVETRDLTLRDFSVTSDAGTRTGGWVYHAGAPFGGPSGYLRRSRIEAIDVQRQVNGFWIAQYEFVWLKDLMLSSFVGGGVGIKAGQTTTSDANQGSELYIEGTQIYGNVLLGPPRGEPSGLAIGIWIEDCDAVYVVNSGVGGTLTNNLRLVANAGGHGPSNHFFNQFVSDATRSSHGVYITGGGKVSDLKFTGCWFASAGQLAGGAAGANGFRSDVAQLGAVEITGSKILNNRGTGIYLATRSSQAALTLSGNALVANGSGGEANNKDGIYVNAPLDALGPVITGNQDTGEIGLPGAVGVGLRTSATANRLVVVGNRFASGVSFGVTPLVQALNEGAGAAFAAGGGAPTRANAGRGYSFAPPGDTDGGLFSTADGIVSIYTNSIEALQVQPNQNAVFRQNLNVAGTLTAAVKRFVQPHPDDPSKEIQYHSVEAPAADVYFRGTVELHRGRNRIEVPEHFRLVARGPYQALATPLGRTASLAVIAAGASGIVIEATRDVAASYIVYAERAAVEGGPPIVPNTHFIPRGEGGFGSALSDPYRELLIRNGTLNPDGTANLDTARRLGWALDAGQP